MKSFCQSPRTLLQSLIALAVSGLCAITLLAGEESSSSPLDHWHARNTNRIYSPLTAVVKGYDTFVAVGLEGAILRSPSGVSWEASRLEGFEHLRGICYGGSEGSFFVAVGDYGTIETSDDAVCWTRQETESFYHLQSVTYGDDKFVAVGDANTILVSDYNAENWSPKASGSNTLYKVCYANNRFVAVGARGTILTSDNANNWTRQTSYTLATLRDVIYAEGMFYAVGGESYGGLILSSPDAVTWQIVAREPTGPISTIVYGNGQYRAFSLGGHILASRDGREWKLALSGDAYSINAATYANNRFVAVGGASPGQYLDMGKIIVSADGDIWRDRTLYTYDGTLLTGVSFSGDGNFYFRKSIDPSGTVFSSSRDGVNQTTLGTLTNHNSTRLFPNKPIVSIGEHGEIYTSRDAIDWTQRTSGVDTTLRGIAEGQGRLVVVGEHGTILTSTDHAETWSTQTNSADYDLFDVAYFNGYWLATGAHSAGYNYQNTVLFSEDAVEWFELGLPYDDYGPLGKLCIGNGKLVAVNLNTSRIISTQDGIHWQSEGYAPFDYVTDLTFGRDTFALTGGSSYNSFPVSGILTSTAQPGVATIGLGGVGNWVLRRQSALGNFNGIAFGRNTFLATAYSGMVLQSDPLLNQGPVLALLPPDQLVSSGELLALDAIAQGTSPLHYQWYKDNTLIEGATFRALDFLSVDHQDMDRYTLRVYNDYGDITSDPLTLTVRPDISVDTSEGISLSVATKIGRSVRIQYRDDLLGEWSTLTTLTLSFSPAYYPDSEGGSFRFYRVELLPETPPD